MATLGSSATPAILAGLGVASTVLLALLLRKAWGFSRNRSERQAEPAALKRQSVPRPDQEKSSTSISACADRFEQACAAVESSANALPNGSRLEFYGLFKQATYGDCEQEEPSSFKHVAHAKWSAWKARKGLAPDDARDAYVRLAVELGILQLTLEEPSAGRTAFGPVHSRPLMCCRGDNQKTSKGDKLCCLAAEGDFESIKEALVEDASLVNVTGEGRMTALHFAADRGYAHIVRLLIEYGADVNHTDDCGETPLHVAIAADQAEIVSLLVGAGADTSLRNNEGYSCAELLVQSETCGQ